MESTSRLNAFAFLPLVAVRHFSYEELRLFPDCGLPSGEINLGWGRAAYNRVFSCGSLPILTNKNSGCAFGTNSEPTHNHVKLSLTLGGNWAL